MKRTIFVLIKALLFSLCLPVWAANELNSGEGVVGRIEALLSKAKQPLTENRLTFPSGDNAVGYAQQVLDLVPQHPKAQQILREVVARYGALSESSLDRAETLRKQELRKAETYRRRGEQIAQRYHLLPEATLRSLEKRIAALKGEDALTEDSVENYPLARETLEYMMEYYRVQSAVALGRGRAEEARHYQEVAWELAYYLLSEKNLRRLEQRIADVKRLQSRDQVSTAGDKATAPKSAQAPVFKAVFIPPAF